MIRTVRYSGKVKSKNGEKTIVVDAHPKEVLHQAGPFIPVEITHPEGTQKILEQEGKDIPVVPIKAALIDTGSSCTIVSPEVVEKLDLVHTGYTRITSVQDEQQQPVYYGLIKFPWGSTMETPVVCCPLKRFECLIGRDTLLHWHFSYNGPDGSIVICD